MADSLMFDPQLMRRYDRPGPCYATYPSTPQLGTHFDADMLRAYIRCSNAEPIPRDLAIHVHVPYCHGPCFHRSCTRIPTRDRALGAGYVARLRREIELIGSLFDSDREVMRLHVGGGTPSVLSQAAFAALFASLREQFRLSTAADRDFSIELDPSVTAADIAAYAQLGFSQASLAMTDLDGSRTVNRARTAERALQAIADCRASGFRSVTVNLMHGLPHQTLEGFARTLDSALAVRPNRIAVHACAHVPEELKARRRPDDAAQPAPELRLQLQALAMEKLLRGGYEYVGMDHFALPGDELARAQAAGALHRDFIGYTTQAHCDLIGLGVGALSHIGDCYSQNARDLATWERAIDAGHLPVWRGRHLDFDDTLRADVIQQLVTSGTVDIAALEARHQIDFRRYFTDALARLASLQGDGLVTVTPERIIATSRGRPLLRIIAMCFDRYCNEPLEPRQPRLAHAG